MIQFFMTYNDKTQTLSVLAVDYKQSQFYRVVTDLTYRKDLRTDNDYITRKERKTLLTKLVKRNFKEVV